MGCASAPRALLGILLLLFVVPSAVATGMRLNVNPVRRVVTMLQMMQKKVESEAKAEQELYNKFMCYCKNGVGSLVTSIKEAEIKISQVESNIAETVGMQKQLEADINKAKADRKEAEQTLAKAKALREKEHQSYTRVSEDAHANIGALDKAIAAIQKGQGVGSFLQTADATALKRLSILMDISEVDRDALTSFFSNKGQDTEDYGPQSGEILGILKQMRDTMEKALAGATSREQAAAVNFDNLTRAKEKQIETLTKEIEAKMIRSGEAGVDLTHQQDDLADTKNNLVEDRKFLVDVTQNCQKKQRENEANTKTRAQELVALSDTIKLLNDDDALDLFKKTLPRPSFLQLSVSMKVLKQRAIQALRRKRGKRDFRLNLIALALRGKKTSFDKVVKMVDDMVKLLSKEQNSDNEKKSYCLKSLDESEDELKELQSSLKDIDKGIADHNEGVKVVTSEINMLTTGIEDLDRQVAEATKQRKDEHAEYQDTMTNDGAAKQLLGMAKNRLAKFYAPALATDASQQQLGEEAQVFASFGGTVETPAPETVHGTNIAVALDQQSDAQDGDASDGDSNAADSGAADSSAADGNDAASTGADSEDGSSPEATGSAGFLQIRSTARLKSKMFAAPPPPPDTMGVYKKSSEESQGILRMLDVLIEDLDKGMTEAETTEKDDQQEYEQFVKDSAKKRAGDSKVLSDKEGVKVDLEANAMKLQQERKGKVGESTAKMEALQGLHSECDWLVKNFEVRRQARSDEIENLNNAKAVLSGAAY